MFHGHGFLGLSRRFCFAASSHMWSGQGISPSPIFQWKCNIYAICHCTFTRRRWLILKRWAHCMVGPIRTQIQLRRSMKDAKRFGAVFIPSHRLIMSETWLCYSKENHLLETICDHAEIVFAQNNEWDILVLFGGDFWNICESERFFDGAAPFRARGGAAAFMHLHLAISVVHWRV